MFQCQTFTWASSSSSTNVIFSGLLFNYKFWNVNPVNDVACQLFFFDKQTKKKNPCRKSWNPIFEGNCDDDVDELRSLQCVIGHHIAVNSRKTLGESLAAMATPAVLLSTFLPDRLVVPLIDPEMIDDGWRLRDGVMGEVGRSTMTTKWRGMHSIVSSSDLTSVYSLLGATCQWRRASPWMSGMWHVWAVWSSFLIFDGRSERADEKIPWNSVVGFIVICAFLPPLLLLLLLGGFAEFERWHASLADKSPLCSWVEEACVSPSEYHPSAFLHAGRIARDPSFVLFSFVPGMI